MADGLMIALAATLMILAAAPAKSAPRVVDGPIAVLSFRNLNDDATLDWMRAGIAETMISDLKKSGKVRVVEREQLDRALTEVALQAKAGEAEESTAAKAGKLVGAKTIVLGSFQKGGSDLRINARFVSVETGEVLDTAKTTGAAANPFALQDKIVAQLLGVPASSPALPKRKVPTKKTVEAYRLYAMALTVASDADRVGYLKQSLDLDPDFVYSADEMARLRERMKGYDAATDAKLQADARRDLATALDASRPADARFAAAMMRFQTLYGQRLWNTLLRETDVVEQARIPVEPGKDATEVCAFWRLTALAALHRRDLALQAGEHYMKTWPAGLYYSSAAATTKSILTEREVWEKRKKEYADDVADHRKTWNDPELHDFAPCIASIWTSEANELMLDSCTSFLAAWEAKSSDRGHVATARFSIVNALVNLGRCGEARPVAEKLQAETHDDDDRLRNLFDSCPADEAEAK